MNTMKSWYKSLIYLSFVFLAVALYNADYLRVPEILSGRVLIASFLFLFAGFISDTISWKQILKKSNYHVALSECLAGFGLSIFSKYIPGKIWIIALPSAYVAEKNRYPLGKLSAITLNAQFIVLWLGLIFGAIGLFLLGGLHLWGWFLLCLWLTLTVVIFSKLAHGGVQHLVRILLRKDIELPRLAIRSTFLVMPWFVALWVFWSIGFYMLVRSLTATDIPLHVGLGFPLSTTLGVMAFIAPGGLGVREGVMVGYLTFAGLPVAEATTIALASRLWFLVGEAFMFIVGWLADKRSHKAICQTGYQHDIDRDTLNCL